MVFDPSRMLLCCFCGRPVGRDDYLEGQFRKPDVLTRQTFGMHQSCFEAYLAPGLTVELEVDDDTDLDS